MKKMTASSLILALVFLSPGPLPYAAAAEVFNAGAAAGAADAAGAGRAAQISGAQLPGAALPIFAAPEAGVAAPFSAAEGLSPIEAVPAALADEPSEANPAEPAAAPGANRAASEKPASFNFVAWMDRLLGVRSRADLGSVSSASSYDPQGPGRSNLSRNSLSNRDSKQPPAPRAPKGDDPSGRGPRDSRAVGAVKSILRIGGSAATVVVLNKVALSLAFGFTPMAAVWAVSSGALFLYPALRAAWRLNHYDSPRLNRVKWLQDAAIGAFLGAVAIALPGLGALSAPINLAMLAAVTGAGTQFSKAQPQADRMLSAVSTLAVIPMIPVAAGAIGSITFGSLFGMMALPVIVTIAFVLRRIISSAETGDAFTMPGGIQPIRFPNYPWLMMGVVFALLSGYGAVQINLALALWTFLGDHDRFDTSRGTKYKILNWLAKFNSLYLIVLAYSALTGFSSPLTFLAIAFLPERAAVWGERLLARLLPKDKPAPSTKVEISAEPEPAPSKLPTSHAHVKTAALLLAMSGASYLGATYLFGPMTFLYNLAFSAILAAFALYNLEWIITKQMGIQPANRHDDPEFFRIMGEIWQDINTKRTAKGKKPIPMPKMFRAPTFLPNAFASGRDPFHAMVAITDGIRDMLLVPANVRDSLIELVNSVPVSSKKFVVFRLAIAGSVSGVSETSTPEEITKALRQAPAPELKVLGERMLRGVLGHEFSHVMDYHMAIGSLSGAISSAFSFASYGVLWTVGHGKILVKKAQRWFLVKVLGRPDISVPRQDLLDPITAAATIKGLPFILKMLAALWGPTAMIMAQMAGSRVNESQADEDGGYRVKDPESLALALGMLMTWKPPRYFLGLIKLPDIAPFAPMFTVNLIEQAYRSGALDGKLDAATRFAVGSKDDDFFFNLFITHPETDSRIERLADMAAALKKK